MALMSQHRLFDVAWLAQLARCFTAGRCYGPLLGRPQATSYRVSQASEPGVLLLVWVSGCLSLSLWAKTIGPSEYRSSSLIQAVKISQSEVLISALTLFPVQPTVRDHCFYPPSFEE